MTFFLRFFKVYFSKDKKLYLSLKNILGFYPHNISLYKLAFQHSSVALQIKEGVKASNERLEYLGDAIISAVIAHYLFKTFPYKDEGFLTKMRSKIVSRVQLNHIASKLGLNLFIESTSAGSKGSSISGDAFEALLGAIYLDKGFGVARDFLLNRVIKNHVDIDEIENKETDFKSKLIEWSQKEKIPIRFSVEELGTGNEKQYLVRLIIKDEVKGEGQHFSKKRAEQIAAEKTCEMLMNSE